ncbi:response regulator transcription factor [Rhizobium sp. LjRoot98]|uniref:response regulator transcription factor n=1 Tax=unclassified Rhizobium TaxID=2613769 RepID=UPI000715395E|nr:MULTISPECIES: response regulator transcription factor [unclassified Rhizobium]KQV36689.1 two-component system response regulator [Rhizobium sp. Root1204]KQY06650.1 two-component system response regulator [Rhizobium sp. Root1334]KRC02433.1 two-component system response regulator [Rhizobium sp. Root73]
MRVMLVEDDPLIARDVITHLERAGFVVVHEKDGESGWFTGDAEEFAAIVLDLGLPKMDGLSVLKRWRAEGRVTPVLILTARGNWQERVEGIDAGADDYLAKPFQMAELLARLRAIIRRSAGQASSTVMFGDITLDTRTKTVTRLGLPIDLTPLEYRCLVFLANNSERNVSQIELTEQLYAQDFERDSNSVEVLVGRLRRKLGRDVIATRRGYGYRINGSAA